MLDRESLPSVLPSARPLLTLNLPPRLPRAHTYLQVMSN